MIDPYAILKVGKNANSETIRRAYRKLARKLHPDVGGDTETFQQLNLAYQVLSDPARRQKYDETGVIDEACVNADSAVVGLLGGHFQAIVQGLLSNGRDLKTCDFVTALRQAVGKGLGDVRVETTKLARFKAQFESIVGRVVLKQGANNFLDGMIRAELAKVEHGLRHYAEQEALHQQALELLQDYEFRAETYQSITLGPTCACAATASSVWHNC